ncbi:low molecular weight phosphotyrosine protein phosphatase [Motilibacter rhizosphaerae]|uniref:Low molecular weight phosphotyrosine protein phosphatase n=1 Tax=Motilibacter rhizosphaerae TaxID=598652 RepID=A0A4Q7NQ07_9ACTN|nr:low molecular weight phosphotyrosine protein phosphatase [Motilibacter rhizosphaerae]
MLCTANRCRSPIAAALLAGLLGDVPAVSSAGFLEPGLPVPPEGVAALPACAPELAAHRSRRVDAAALTAAGLVVTMERAHVRDAAVLAPACWPRTFPLVDLAARVQRVGGRLPGEGLRAYAARLHEGRRLDSVLRGSAADDVADPMGQSGAAYVRTAEELRRLLEPVAAALRPR